jgi:hypothetical protein
MRLNMKSNNFLFVLLVIFSSCENKDEPRVDEEVTGKVDTSVSFEVSETKEPFIEFKDKAGEAWLVVNGIDHDNQVNGKVALADINAVQFLPLSYKTENGDLFIRQKTEWLLSKDTTIREITLPVELAMFKNLSNLSVSYSSLVNLKELSNLKVLEIERRPPAPGLPPKFENGDMDFSDSPKLEKIAYHGIGKLFNLKNNSNLEELQLWSNTVETLDISNNSKLELIDLEDSKSLKIIYVSPMTFKKIEEATSYADIQKWKKPEGAVWKVKM